MSDDDIEFVYLYWEENGDGSIIMHPIIQGASFKVRVCVRYWKYCFGQYGSDKDALIWSKWKEDDFIMLNINYHSGCTNNSHLINVIYKILAPKLTSASSNVTSFTSAILHSNFVYANYSG